MYPHRIRLHGPWEYEPLVRTAVYPDGRIAEVSGPVPESGRMKIPSVWSGTPLDEFRGRVRWRRLFHAPRALEPDERLWIVFHGVDYFAGASLNGTRLGCHEGYFEPFEFDVTSLVEPRNALVVDVDCPAEADPEYQRLIRGSRGAGIWRDVTLEVRSLAFLRDVRIRTELDRTTGIVTAAGTVVGEPAVPLGLDLSLDGNCRAAQDVKASPAGMPFTIAAHMERVAVWRPKNLGVPKTLSVVLELHGKARTLDTRRYQVGFRTLLFQPGQRAQLNGCEFPVNVSDLVSCSRHLPDSRALDSASTGNAGDSVPDLGSLFVARMLEGVSEPARYERADAEGILLWQPFPLRGGYSTDPAFHREAERQASAMVQMVGHHASIALWSCHENPTEHDLQLDRAVHAVIQRLDPSRPCLLDRFE